MQACRLKIVLRDFGRCGILIMKKFLLKLVNFDEVIFNTYSEFDFDLGSNNFAGGLRCSKN